MADDNDDETETGHDETGNTRCQHANMTTNGQAQRDAERTHEAQA